MFRRHRATLALVVWTLLVWTSRIRNVWGDAELDTAGKIGRTALAASFTLLAVAVAVALWRRAGSPAVALAVGALAAWTTVVWLVRGTGIVLDDHDLGFTVVHTVLAVVSVGLATLALRETVADSRARAGADARAGLREPAGRSG